MSSNKSLSGEYLKNLYTENKLCGEYLTHENLKTLLNYELDCMGDTIDSNYNFEIIDFCVEKLKDMEPVDEQKMAFLGQKIALEAKEQSRKRRSLRIRKYTAAAAAIGIVAGAVIFSGQEGLAGKFDLVHRLISQDKGEQLVVKAPDMTLTEIEMKEGHLPKKLLDNYQLSSSHKDITPMVSSYSYTFVNTSNKELFITIKEYPNVKSTFNNEIEINKKSMKSKKSHNNTYYYSTNMDVNKISWSFGNNIYIISGELDFNELEDVLSLYIEEQQ